MKTIIKIILTAKFCICMIYINAQQDAMFTHYSFNTLAVNPAYAGSRDALTATVLHRNQWVGFDGAPNTQTITIHSPIFNNKIGLGLSVLKDQIGPLNKNGLSTDFSYKLKFQKSVLAFGLKGSINIMKIGLSSLNLDQSNDDAFNADIQSQLLPNFGFGAYYNSEKWYLGLSIPMLLENNFNTNNTSSSLNNGKEKRHFYFISGAVFNLTKEGNIKFKPTTLMKLTSGAPIEIDLTNLFILNEKFEVGVMYRTNDGVGILLGYHLSDQVRFGYSFDWSFTNTSFKYNAGSHEVMLLYDFIYKNKGRVKSPRYF